MDIVAESLSANILKARNVTVRGQDVFEWFQSKLSGAVSFAGVFDDLSAAPKRNGAVAIVGSKDYIYSSTTSAWQELGDEGQIGALRSLVNDVSAEISSALNAFAPEWSVGEWTEGEWTWHDNSLWRANRDHEGTASEPEEPSDGSGTWKRMQMDDMATVSDLRYRIAGAEVGTAGGYVIADRTVNLVTLPSGTSEATIVFPSKTPGYSRDFMVRLVIEGAEVPQISFAEPDGSDVAFDEDDDAWAGIGQGVNILIFTDTSEPPEPASSPEGG